MKAMRIAVALATVIALASGCSSNAGSTGDTGANSAPAVPVPSASEPAAPMSEVGDGAKLVQGAAAAPATVGGKVYTQEMYQGFAASVTYETTKSADMALLETPDSNGAPLGYEYGRQVCGAVANDHLDLRTIADNIHANTGLTLGAAQAVIAGAARHLCGIASMQGYLTYFDGQVRLAQARIHQVTGFWVDEEMVGWSSRLVCDYLQFYGESAGLRPALEGFKPHGTSPVAMPFPIEDSPGVYSANFDTVITVVASNWCNIDGDQLLGPTYFHTQ